MHVNNKQLFVFFALLLLSIMNSSGQNKVPLLERKVSLDAENTAVESVLQQIGETGNFTFSYAPSVIKGLEPVSIKARNLSVRDVLNSLFDGAISFKEKGNHIILIRKEEKKQVEEASWFIISGYIKDNDGSEIPEVSIFDKKSRESTISNKYGFFNLKIDGKQKDKQLILSINKVQYKDTIVYVKQTGNSVINITLYPKQAPQSSVDSIAIRDSTLRADQMAFINFLLSQESQVNARNIKDTIYEKYQVSLIPYIGTNMRLSGNTVNDYSFNVFGGYSMGTRKVELAGLFNIDRDSVKYLQMAGLLNFNGGHVEGVQAAGITNVNLKSVNGVELAGLLNVNIDSIEGVQMAGLLNVSLEPVNGFQGAGLLNANISKNSSAVQAAGLLNVSTGNLSGAQIASVMNVGVNKVKGIQISSLFNYARNIEGTQIGFLNISDSCTGVPFGIISYSHRGYHQFEISADEFYPINVALRTGVHALYNIVSAGMKLDSLEDIQWYFGYGLGSSLKLGKNWRLNFDATVNQPLHGNILNYFSPISKLNIMAEKRFSKYFSIAAGPSLNYFIYKSKDDYLQSLAENIPSSVISSGTHPNNYKDKLWVGGKIALRFF